MINTCPLLRSLSTAVVLVNFDYTISWLNPAAELLLDMSLRRATGKRIDQLLVECDALVNAVERVINGLQSCTVREAAIGLPARPEALLVDCTVTRLDDPDIQAGMVLELWQVDNLVKLSRDSWTQGHQDATRTMIRGLAHEIKNPLGGLRGAAQLLDSELPNSELREYTRIITHEADRLSKLVDRLTSPWKPLERETVNLHEILEHVYRLVQVEIQGRVTIYRDYDPSLPDICVERDAMVQVFLNLVRNAAQAVPGGGRITLRSRVRRRVSIAGKLYRQALRVEVEDDGPGVPEELRDKIFFPLVTGRAEGTGLGLSLAQEIVGRHHGRIDYERADGLTRFIVTLPVET